MSAHQQQRKMNVESLRASADLVAVVQRWVPLKKSGREWSGCCPFHDERTPSFYVNPAKGFVHCFGCGAHHDVFGFVQRVTGCTFVEACRQLGAGEFTAANPVVRERTVEVPEGVWVPLTPVPDDAPDLLADNGWTVPIWNPKQGRISRMKPSRVDAYRNAHAELLGYVLRIDIPDKHDRAKTGKWTPTVTWCIGPDGIKQWCLQAFPEPRPLFGLDALVVRREAHVCVVEGEKCGEAGASALPAYVCVSWPGGSNGIRKVDWSPLEGRDVVLWPDADDAGVKAMLGHTDKSGRFHAGIAHLLNRVRVRSLRYIDTEGQPKGWDIADATASGWTPGQLAEWAATRVIDIDVVRG